LASQRKEGMQEIIESIEEEAHSEEEIEGAWADNYVRSPAKRIEWEPRNYLEQTYFKVPGERLIAMGHNRGTHGVDSDNKKINRLLRQFSRDQYTDLHIHTELDFIPSRDDVEYFLYKEQIKTMVIGVLSGSDEHDEEEQAIQQELVGYTVIRKTKRTPKIRKRGVKKELKKRLKRYDRSIDIGPDLCSAEISRLSQQYHFRVKLIFLPELELPEEFEIFRDHHLENILIKNKHPEELNAYDFLEH
jgi:hypothetical protein